MAGNAAKQVDADTHVSENEQMWEHFEREMYRRRPVLNLVGRIESNTQPPSNVLRLPSNST